MIYNFSSKFPRSSFQFWYYKLFILIIVRTIVVIIDGVCITHSVQLAATLDSQLLLTVHFQTFSSSFDLIQLWMDGMVSDILSIQTSSSSFDPIQIR